MARGRAFFSFVIALLALSAAVAAVAGAEGTLAAPVEAASPAAVALSNAAGETKKAAAAAAAAPTAAPITPRSGVQVTVFRASGWPAGTLTIPAAVVNDVSDRLSLFD